jgi:hypothetical protein
MVLSANGPAICQTKIMVVIASGTYAIATLSSANCYSLQALQADACMHEISLKKSECPENFPLDASPILAPISNSSLRFRSYSTTLFMP